MSECDRVGLRGKMGPELCGPITFYITILTYRDSLINGPSLWYFITQFTKLNKLHLK